MDGQMGFDYSNTQYLYISYITEEPVHNVSTLIYF